MGVLPATARRAARPQTGHGPGRPGHPPAGDGWPAGRRPSHGPRPGPGSGPPETRSCRV